MNLALPAQHRAGDTLADTFALSDYPASASWVLRFTLSSATVRYQATCTASGADHALSVPASTTAGWVAGAYSWSADVTRAAERYSVGAGSIQILPDLAAATSYDTRTNTRKALEAAEAALVAYGAKAYLHSIEINGRRQQFHSPGDFLAFISRLRMDVAREENADRMAQGLRPKNKLLVRFTGR